MNEGIIYIRDWIRTNGEMSEDGKSITYDCLQLETVISEALKKGQTFDLGAVSLDKQSEATDNCGNCMHEKTNVLREPCNTCNKLSNWEQLTGN